MARARLALLVAALWMPVDALPGTPGVLRVAITPVLVENRLDLNRQLVEYLGRKLAVKAVLVQRRSYKQVSELLEHGEVDAAFTCGLPYVLDHERFGVELLAAPEVKEGPVYFSYVIVPADSPARSLQDLRGMRYAFSDPLSNSGWLVPARELARSGTTPEAFFSRTMFTYSHAASVEAVSVRFVDGASVDSYVYDALARSGSATVAATKVIARSGPHPFPPVVVRPGLSAELKGRLRAALLAMDHDPDGQAILAAMGFERFVAAEDRSFDGIRAMLRAVNVGYAGALRGRPAVVR
jgi:phosphonate transport system substrate-binding protein